MIMTGFDSPYILLFLLTLPILFYAYIKILAHKKKEAVRFSSLSFIKSAMGDRKKINRDMLLFYLSIAVIGLMILGFSNPTIPLKKTQEGVNVILVLDISGSMQATDYNPTRLEAAKRSAEILLKSLKAKDHAGIVTFESGATTAAYLSPYKQKVIEKLRSIAPRDGKTAIGDGLSLGIDMATSIPNKKKVVILLSDGVNNAGVISPAEAVAFAKTNDIQVYAMDGLLKKGGGKRISDKAKAALKEVLEDVALEIAEKAVKLARHAGRKTIKAEDIKLAFKH